MSWLWLPFFLNITLLMWKQFIVFESLMILPLFRIRRILLMWRVVKFLCLCIMKIMLLCGGYFLEFIHDATENYYEGGIYACWNCNNIKFPPCVLKFLKLCLFYLPMLVDYCSHKLFVHKIPMHRKWVRLKCASHILHDALFIFQFLSFMWASLKSSCLLIRLRRIYNFWLFHANIIQL